MLCCQKSYWDFKYLSRVFFIFLIFSKFELYKIDNLPCVFVITTIFSNQFAKGFLIDEGLSLFIYNSNFSYEITNQKSDYNNFWVVAVRDF